MKTLVGAAEPPEEQPPLTVTFTGPTPPGVQIHTVAPGVTVVDWPSTSTATFVPQGGYIHIASLG